MSTFQVTASYGRSSPSHLGEAGPETPSLCQDWLCQNVLGIAQPCWLPSHQAACR